MLNRKVLRVIYNGSEVTSSVSVPGGSGIGPALTSDSIYIGYTGKFASRYIEVKTLNVITSVMTCKYWNGSTFVLVDDFQDQTSLGGKSLAQSGFISWENQSDWQASNLSGMDSDVKLFWIKLELSVNTSGVIGSFLNLFCDDGLIKAYYPEMLSDARYLPPGQTNFLPQYIAAKNLCVLRLKQRKVISEESQIIDINQVAIAAVHAAAWITISPIAVSDASKMLSDAAEASFSDEILRLFFDVDDNNDGIIEPIETQNVFSSVGVFRR